VPEEPTASCHLAYVLDFGSRRQLRLLEILFAEPAFRKEFQAIAHAAHVQAFHLDRLDALADDELGRAAADIDHQAFMRCHGQTVADADENHACFFTSRNDLDGKP